MDREKQKAQSRQRKAKPGASILARTHDDEEFQYEAMSRMLLQKCGGGRRIIRRKVGDQ
jgi:hypothetical protein